jgi:DNA-binding transcriptional LysR family regulator
MKKIDFYDMDGNVLRTFLTILEESSVSRADDKLGVTQSAVSHTLAKLRRILGDPLFVRSGQGLTPTETALSLKSPVQDVLDQLRELTSQRHFDPHSEALHFRVAANDMQRDLIFPALSRNARKSGVALSLTMMPSGVPTVALLRDALCDLIVTPVPPDAPDLFQQKLFTGSMMCFYDASQTAAPTTIDAYMSAEHIAVDFVLGGTSNDVLIAPDLPFFPKPIITVSNFSGIPPFVEGTKILTTQLEYMQRMTLKKLTMAPLPFHSEPVTVYLVWHERSNNDPAHKWLRTQVKAIANASDLTSPEKHTTA